MRKIYLRIVLHRRNRLGPLAMETDQTKEDDYVVVSKEAGERILDKLRTTEDFVWPADIYFWTIGGNHWREAVQVIVALLIDAFSLMPFSIEILERNRHQTGGQEVPLGEDSGDLS